MTSHSDMVLLNFFMQLNSFAIKTVPVNIGQTVPVNIGQM